MRRQRAGRCRTALGAGEQGDIGLAKAGELAGQRQRRIHQHAVEHTGKHGLDGRFPAGIDLQRFAKPARLVQPEPGQPAAGGGFFLAKRGVLQGFQRCLATARGLQLLARFVQRGLHLALFVLHTLMRDLVLVEHAAEGLDAFALGVVFGIELFGGGVQRGDVGRLLLALQCLATARQVDALAIEVGQLGPLDLGGTRRFAGGTRVHVPARLPVGQLGLGAALRFAGLILDLLQRFELRLAFGQEHAKGFDLFAIGGDMPLQLVELARGLALRAKQPVGQVAVVPYLLLDAGDLGADLIDVGLHAVQMLGRALVTVTHAFQLRLDLALAGQVPLDLEFGMAQTVSPRLRAGDAGSGTPARAAPPLGGSALPSTPSSARRRAPGGSGDRAVCPLRRARRARDRGSREWP